MEIIGRLIYTLNGNFISPQAISTSYLHKLSPQGKIRMRILTDVIEQLKQVIPSDQTQLLNELNLIFKSAAYAAPEIMQIHWNRTADILFHYVGKEPTVEWHNKIISIWSGVYFPTEIPKNKSCEELEIALAESLKLQSHYAIILNEYDGGERMIFKNSQEWIERLKYLKVIK